MKKLLTTNYCLLTKRGFTLIETLVALSIFSVSIVALISITGSGVANTNYAKNKFIASYLAQEGVEMVRNIRDTTALSGGDWEMFAINLSGCVLSPGGCTIEPQTLFTTLCPDPGDPPFLGCPALNYDNNSGFYYSTGTPSIFTRTIMVTDTGSGYEVNVTSIVSWRQGSTNPSVTYSESLFDWIQ